MRLTVKDVGEARGLAPASLSPSPWGRGWGSYFRGWEIPDVLPWSPRPDSGLHHLFHSQLESWSLKARLYVGGVLTLMAFTLGSADSGGL